MYNAFARLFYRLSRLYWRLTRPLSMGVRLLLIRDGEVLLVRHRYQDDNWWYLPGGGVRRGEMLEAAARREAAEELGATLGPLHLLGVYTNFFEYKSDHVIVFVCHEFTLTGKTDLEIEAWGFFALDNLPELSPGSRRRIEEYQRGQGPYIGAW